MKRALLIGPRFGPGNEGATRSQPAYVNYLKRVRALARESVLRVGVDGGVAFWRRLGVGRADLAIGDWDSTRGGKRPLTSAAEVVRTFPRDKNESDLNLALAAAVRAGARELYCAGFSGGRPDHQLGVWSELAEAAAGAFGSVQKVVLWAPGWDTYFLSARLPSWSARLPLGTVVSVMALGGAAKGVTLRGFQFPLRGARLDSGTRGLSNRATAARVQVSLERGRLAVFVSQAY